MMHIKCITQISKQLIPARFDIKVQCILIKTTYDIIDIWPNTALAVNMSKLKVNPVKLQAKFYT